MYFQWVYNILNHEKESRRIVFENKDPQTGFVFLPDLKWDGNTSENLYLVRNSRAVQEQNATSLESY